MSRSSNYCGFLCWHPEWLNRFVNVKWFMIVYGFLGTVQVTSYIYFTLTMTTLQTRFKIPSETTGEWIWYWSYIVCAQFSFWFVQKWNSDQITQSIHVNIIRKQFQVRLNQWFCFVLFCRCNFDGQWNISDYAIADIGIFLWTTQSNEMDCLGCCIQCDIMLYVGRTAFYVWSRWWCIPIDRRVFVDLAGMFVSVFSYLKFLLQIFSDSIT